MPELGEQIMSAAERVAELSVPAVKSWYAQHAVDQMVTELCADILRMRYRTHLN
jgi:hypothetical protein